MSSMNATTRRQIIDSAAARGFQIELKADGTDLYDKNLVFRSHHYASRVFIHRETGIDKGSGKPRYLKVAVHPDHFKAELVNQGDGIEDYLNRRSKINRHSGSNYVGCPLFEGNEEPCAKCYKVRDYDALDRLLSGLGRL